VKAYCAPGGRALAELVLAMHGDAVEEIIEHPWLTDDGEVILVADLPALEHLRPPLVSTLEPPATSAPDFPSLLPPPPATILAYGLP